MSLTGILDLLGADRAVNEAVRIAREGGEPLVDITGPPGLRAPLVAALARSHPEGADRTVLAVTATGREAEDLAAALRCFLPAHAVAEFPAWETLPHERLSPRSDTVGRRLAVLRRLAHPEAEGTGGESGPIRVVVAPVRAVLQPVVRGLGELVPVALQAGDEVELTDVVERLAAAAYARTELVERRGEFAVRGGILDVFPPTEEHPLRIEFWGDTVEEIRWFAVADQRSLEVADRGLWAPPCRELLLTDQVRARAAALAERLPGVADLLAKVAAGLAVEGMESLTPALVDGMEPVLDALPAGTHVVLCDPERVRARAHDLGATSKEFLDASWMSAAAGSAVPVDLEPVLGTASFWSLAEVREHALKAGLPWWSISPFGLADGEGSPSGASVSVDEGELTARVFVPDVQAPQAYRGDREQALADIGGWLSAGWQVAIITEGHGLAKRVVEMLAEADLAVNLVEDLSTPPKPAVATVGTGGLGRGFIAETLKLAVLTESDLTGGQIGGTTTKDMRKMPARRRNVVDPMQLTPGDAVVHEQHGVGKFVEMMQRTIGGATREYLVIEYAPSKRGQPGDRLFVPSDALDQVTRYIGGESPTLNKLGGSDWAKTKGRARKAIKVIAGELIQLYSARMATAGFAFSPDTPWQRELEDAFAYVETPDQLVTIEEVKADMEKPIPMDRLICGDVGYGKTEIAVRAAFKAVQDGKQVAVLVPTTLLVQQHLDTFTERYVNFPVVVKGLSRFSTEADAKAVIAGLQDGSVDIVIGTHRLLTGQIKFKDLGLVVVDEEQRFGVEHKERLKQLRTNVDVLAMSATPIPRTLELAVTGIREMSTLATPPEERHPVLTFVGGYDERQITAAIRRELLREGSGLLHPQPGGVDRAGRGPDPGTGARGENRHRARKDGRAPAGTGDRRLLGKEVRRPGLYHDRGDRVGHLECEHADPGASRPDGSVPAAPAARRGGAGPGAGLLLLSVSTGTAAHRDRAGPVADDRREHRPRRRDAGGDEGPGDPGGGESARWRAVRAHCRGRLRPVHPVGWRGGRRFPRYRPGGAQRGQDRSADRRAPAARLPARGALAAGGVSEDRRDRYRSGAGSRPGRGDRPLRTDAGAGVKPARSGSAAVAGPIGRVDRDHRSGQQCQVRVGGAARFRRNAVDAALSGLVDQADRASRAGAPTDDGADRWPAAARHRGVALGQRFHPGGSDRQGVCSGRGGE